MRQASISNCPSRIVVTRTSSSWFGKKVFNESQPDAPESLAFNDIHMKYVVEPGEFEIMAGNSSRDADLQKVILKVTK